MSVLYRFIAATYPVTLLCRILGVPRSTYYAWAQGQDARGARLRADEALVHEITVVHLASRGAYGVPRVHAELRRLGHGVRCDPPKPLRGPCRMIFLWHGGEVCVPVLLGGDHGTAEAVGGQ